MPSWSELTTAVSKQPEEKRGDYVIRLLDKTINSIATQRNRNVILYASAFLQKPDFHGLFTSITSEDINGFMAGVYKCDPNKDLLLILHTPGGLAAAAETIVGYLRSKFKKIDVAIPTYAMSAGTMIALGCDRIIMDRQSQLGPIDPQMAFDGRHYSAHSIVGQFDKAKEDIQDNPPLAHAWAPVLRSLGPALLEEARRTHSYGQTIVSVWLEKYMFANQQNADDLASKAANFFSSDKHGAHGKRISREDAKSHRLKIINMEDDQDFQDNVLTLYHLSTIAFEQTPVLKMVLSSAGGRWIKNLGMPKQESNP
ncbi:MAG: hypothetical protein OXL40_13605 [Bacteroidota bacterium]|nr:hypothetical protein [Bacteroidota bacterium]